MRRPLNLASRPFRNETLPALLFGLAAVALLALTVQHSLALEGLRPGRGTPLEQEVARLEQELSSVRSEANALSVPDPEAGAIQRWKLLRELVDRGALRWTEMLSVFEQALPGGVRLVSLAPQVEPSGVSLDLTLVARSGAEGLDLMRVLENRPEFDQVYPLSLEAREGGEQVNCSLLYHPPPPSDASSAEKADQPPAGGAAASNADAPR